MTSPRTVPRGSVSAGLDRAPDPGSLLAALSRDGGPVLHLDGGGPSADPPFDDPWSVAGLVALDARSALRAAPADADAVDRALRRLDALIAARPTGPPETGVAVLASYEALSGIGGGGPGPELSALEVDAAVRLGMG